MGMLLLYYYLLYWFFGNGGFGMGDYWFGFFGEMLEFFVLVGIVVKNIVGEVLVDMIVFGEWYVVVVGG